MKLLMMTTILTVFCCLTSFQSHRTATYENTIADVLQSRYTKSQIDSFIREIFADYADDLVFNSTSGRLKLITEFLNRVEVASKPEFAGKKFTLLSELQLQNKYNKDLKRDQHIDPGKFNPLKYNFPMVSKSKMFYRIDNTDLLIIIYPMK